jgi:hypothetical protein
MSTFLELCQKTARECGVGGSTDAAPKPLTVIGQIGELNRIVAWVNDAYIEIQDARDWRWLRKKFTVDTADGVNTYAPGVVTDVDDAALITRFKSWRLDDRLNPPKLFLTSSGVESQVFLSWTRWDNFAYLYETGALQNQTSQPVHITVNPKDEIQLGIAPNDIYTVSGEYHKSPQILTADADVPEMPSQYHNLIMYQAMEWYGYHEVAPEVIARAEKGINRIMNQLRKNQETPFRVGGPLA